MKLRTKYTTTLALSFLLINGILAKEDTLKIHMLGHASLMFEYQGVTIHVDPRSSEADYSSLPKADFVFITHAHGDHYELKALSAINKSSTLMICTEEVKNKNNYDGNIEIMANGDNNTYNNILVEAVPAYNFEKAFHPKGVGNGYIFTFGNTRIYVAGDTEDIPELSSVKANIAFLPMNQPYTMTEEQAANAAKIIKPEILYIYHNRGSDNEKLKSLLADEKSMEIRIGKSVYFVNTESGKSWITE